MDFKALRWQILRGSLGRRLFLKAFLFTLAMVIISFVQITNDVPRTEPFMLNLDECPLDVRNRHVNLTGVSKPVSAFVFQIFGASIPGKKSQHLAINVFKELMEKHMLDFSARALCVGEGSDSDSFALRELGFSNAFGVHVHPFFSLWKKRFVYELDFKDNYFDFLFSRALDRVSVPALLVVEIERVLRPGGTGAMLLGTRSFYSRSLVRSVAPVSSFLKSSNIVHVCSIGSFTLVIFKKRFDNVALFEHYRLPDKCPSIANNKPLMKFIEPLADNKLRQLDTEISYLPKLMNISSRNRLVYINVGAGDLVNSSIINILEPNYPFLAQDFDVYVIDHNTSALFSYVKKPGITFVYHPGLVGDVAAPLVGSDEDFSEPPEEEGGFEFIRWFKETIIDGDFVVLMMNGGAAELRILLELFETGTICHIDELFVCCPDTADCNGAVCGDCMSVFKALRNAGVFAHQWLGD